MPSELTGSFNYFTIMSLAGTIDKALGGTLATQRRYRDRKAVFTLKWTFIGFYATILVAFKVLITSVDAACLRSNKNSQNLLKRSTDGQQSDCRSTACFTRSATMISAMDQSTDPCENFYQYACGNFNRNTTDSRIVDQFGGTSFSRLEAVDHGILKNILEQPTETLTNEAEKLAQRFYQSCLLAESTDNFLTDDSTRNAQLQLLDQVGGWSVIDEISYGTYSKKQWDFQEAFETVHNFYVNCFFGWTVRLRDTKQHRTYPFRYVIEIKHSESELLNPDYDVNEMKKSVGEIVTYLLNINTSSLSGGNETVLAEAGEDITEVVSRIYQIDPKPSHKYFKIYTIAQLNNLAPFVNWSKFFESAILKANITIEKPQSLPVSVSSIRFLQKLSIFVQELLATENGQTKLKNYLSWRVAKTNYEIMKLRWLRGKETDDIENDCVSHTANQLDFAVNSMLLRKKINSKSNKNIAETMAKSLTDAFKEMVKNLDWLEEDTFLQIKEKVDLIDSFIGYPEFILNSTKLETFYSGLEIKPDEYLLNNIRLKQFSILKTIPKLGQPFDKTEWRVDRFYVMYQRYLNHIFLPSDVLQEPFFDATFPPAVNFGSIGSLFGHEIVHGFVGKTLQYDFRKNSMHWLKNGIVQLLGRRSQCFVQQYSNFNIKNTSINGVRTLEENIADNVGLKIAYIALRNWIKTHQIGFQSLPGLTFSPEELFFLSFAQTWCSDNDDEIFLNDEHSPRRFRVIGTLANSPEFSAAFGCPISSLMSRKKKCEYW